MKEFPKVKVALVFGSLGQDGWLLSKYLIARGYNVIGTTRRSPSSVVPISSDNFELVQLNPEDFGEVLDCIETFCPNEIYNLTGQSSVGQSFARPVSTFDSFARVTLNIFEALLTAKKYSCRVYTAGSSEVYGDTAHIIGGALEESAHMPTSPYGIAKSTAMKLTEYYRKNFSLYAVNGILFNHESNRRGPDYVTSKIINSAYHAKYSGLKSVKFGNLEIYRDWGWAEEYVEAMNLMLGRDQPDDFIICTGKTISLQKFMKLAFEFHDLDWRNFVTTSSDYNRKNDIIHSSGNPGKAERELNWIAKQQVEQVIENMSKYRLTSNKDISK